MKKLILYDLDGTLVDTREDIVRAANHMRAQFQLPPLPAERISSYVGKGMHHLVKNCLETGDLKKIEKGGKMYRQFYGEHMMDHSRLFPGVKEVLDHFKSRKQAVVTNKPNPYSRNMLTALGIASYFVEIVGGDSDYPKKPDPAAVQAIMKQGKVEPSEALFIGDSRIDVETARNAGVSTLMLTHGFESADEIQSARPDALVRDFRELLDFVKKQKL